MILYNVVLFKQVFFIYQMDGDYLDGCSPSHLQIIVDCLRELLIYSIEKLIYIIFFSLLPYMS
ncbi:hypothetical protein pb186bvf_005162 [Paramecium bursaria]